MVERAHFAFGLFSRDKNSHFHDIAFNRHKFSVILNTTNTFILSKKPNIIGTLAGFTNHVPYKGV